MEQKRYVQHISGKGERWKVHTEFQNYWVVYSHMEIPPHFTLPKSDFLPCEPKEEWEDVTEEYQTLGYTEITSIRLGPGCRFKLINGLHYGHAFIIERKK